MPEAKVSNFKNWESYYFFVRADLHSSERPFSGRRRMWKETPGRSLNSWSSRLLEEGHSVSDPNSASVPELPMTTDDSTEGDLVLAENEVAQDAQDRTDTSRVEDDNQVAIAQVVAPETIQRTKSREERDKAVETGEKRDASTTGLTDEGPPQKTFRLTRGDSDHPNQFSFLYVGDRYLVMDQEAACQLWQNITLPGARAFPDPEELTNALANDLSTTFTQVVLNVEEMKKTIAHLEREGETYQAEVGSLNDEVARLGKRESDLMGKVAKLQADLTAARDHEEKECSRLRNDRAAKVARTTQKAQARLDKGAEEIVAVLVRRGAVISEAKLENLANESKAANDEVDALEIMELTDVDLNMSPDQLGFGRVRSSTQITPVLNQHGSNSELVSQSDLRHVTVNEQDPEA
ncbi:unnamed protein product [Arabidopsis halleri]